MTHHWRTVTVVTAIAIVVLLAPTSVLLANNFRGDKFQKTATTQVGIHILPFTETRLDSDRITIEMPAWCGDSRAILVGGTITTNVPVALGVSITPPPNAPRSTEWEARALVDYIDRPGVHRFDRLLQIQASQRGPSSSIAQYYTLNLFAATADGGPIHRRARARGSASPVDLSYGGSRPGYGQRNSRDESPRGGGGSRGRDDNSRSSRSTRRPWRGGTSPDPAWACRPPLKPDPGPPGTVTLLVMPRP